MLPSPGHVMTIRVCCRKAVPPQLPNPQLDRTSKCYLSVVVECTRCHGVFPSYGTVNRTGRRRFDLTRSYSTVSSFLYMCSSLNISRRSLKGVLVVCSARRRLPTAAAAYIKFTRHRCNFEGLKPVVDQKPYFKEGRSCYFVHAIHTGSHYTND